MKELITCIIIDDEEKARNVLSSYVKECFPNIEIVSTANDVPSAVEKIREKKPHFVFLDVQMPNYAGYELIDFFEEIDFEIIFVTGYDAYAIRAFELNAIDYLLKPINKTRLVEAVHKLEKVLETSEKMKAYKDLLDNIKNDCFDKLILPELGNRRVVDLKEVTAIEANGSYTTIHLRNNQQVVASKNLAYFEKLFSEKKNFFRSHRTWLVNIDLVTFFDKSNLEITLDSGLLLSVSRRKKTEFEALFNPRSEA